MIDVKIKIVFVVATDKIFIFNEIAEVDVKLEHSYISCKIVKYKRKASEMSKDGIVPLPNGISVESKQEIRRFVDCLYSKAHQAAVEGARLWEQQYDKHPSVKILKHRRAGTLNHLIALCTYVYNGL